MQCIFTWFSFVHFVNDYTHFRKPVATNDKTVATIIKINIVWGRENTTIISKYRGMVHAILPLLPTLPILPFNHASHHNIRGLPWWWANNTEDFGISCWHGQFIYKCHFWVRSVIPVLRYALFSFVKLHTLSTFLLTNSPASMYTTFRQYLFITLNYGVFIRFAEGICYQYGCHSLYAG